MQKKYWLHRISHNWEISYVLLDEKGYLSLGWSRFSKTDILNAARKGEAEFENAYKTVNDDNNRSRWNMWYFAQFQPDDIVVVPRYNGEFSICRILEPAKPIGEIQHEVNDFCDKNSKRITWDNGLLKREGEEGTVDLGFVVKVEICGTRKRAEYADSALNSRMKMRQTNGDISDLQSSVDAANNAKGPINFYEKAIEEGSKKLLERIEQDLDDRKFEFLVKAYMDKAGADYSYIPAKNERGKTNHADADVIAVFKQLGLAIQIQAKHHSDETDEWAVEQIAGYKEQLEDKDSDLYHEEENNLVIIPWVISSCEFTEQAIRLAETKNVRLINGNEFSRMLMDIGLANIDKYQYI